MSIDIEPTTILGPSEGIGEHPAVNLTHNTKGSAWNRIGNNKLIGVDQWRYNYNPVTGIFESRTIMGQWTNEIQDPRDFSQSSWAKESGATIDTDVGIDGETKNIKVVPDGTNNGRIRQDKTVSDNSNEHTVYFLLKKDMSSSVKLTVLLTGGTTAVSKSTIFNSNNGIVVAGDVASIEDNGRYWEVSLQIANNGTGNTTLSKRYTPDDDNQTNAQTFDVPSVFLNRSSPPPTPVYGEVAGQSYTQDPDIATVTDLDAINFNPSEGTFVIKFKNGSESIPEDREGIIGVGSGSDNNIDVYCRNDASEISLRSEFGGSYVGAITTSIDRTKINTCAITFKNDDELVFALNGNIIDRLDTSGLSLTSNEIKIGKGIEFGEYLNGFLESIPYYPRKFSDTNLIQETTL